MIQRPAWADRLRNLRQQQAARWSQLRAVLAFEQKAAELNVLLPTRESLLRMLKGWERGDHTPSDVYRFVWSAVFNVPERALFAELAPPILVPSDPKQANGLSAQLLTVSIAIVLSEQQTLLVRRRDDVGGLWQFPAGVVKPGADPAKVAVSETLAETGIHCSAVRHLGRRLHPITQVMCEYYLCDHLTGSPENLDPVENSAVLWVEIDDLTRFIPEESIFPPVLERIREGR